MQNNDFMFEYALKNRFNKPKLGEMDYGDVGSGLMQAAASSTPSIPQATSATASAAPGMPGGIGIGTPEMMAAGAAMQIIGQYLDAPYKEMAAKQSMEEQRKDRQSAALMNLQNISKLYGNL